MNPEAVSSVIQIVRGHPTEEEIAALVAVLLPRSVQPDPFSDNRTVVSPRIRHRAPYFSPLSWQTVL